ncbi:MAG TPA: NADH:flavin oxidoreductase/NADH oxidase [Candidatus Sulfotelmatobacter sp.]|nr:NADH:flavin oxidoreductase/NADH oxidase [Candidatus Sulfotelmatobacter sp.]
MTRPTTTPAPAIAGTGGGDGRTVPHLFSPFAVRGVTLRNRIVVSSMCQYSCRDGLLDEWHMVHLGSRAVGGAGLIFVEATAVEPAGRISPEDSGLWDDTHIEPLARVVRFCKGQGAAMGMQLAHAGRKASVFRPWEGGKPLTDGRAWETVAPSPMPFAEGWPAPRELRPHEIDGCVAAFGRAAARARAAGFDALEVHAAHGYLIHTFLSPLSNRRTDAYGGSFENRCRLLLEIADAVRREWPADRPLFVRLSCTDWIEGGWGADDTVALARLLKGRGVDAMDCSSGGLSLAQKMPATPGYNVPFAERVRREAGLPAGVVGLITEAQQAQAIIAAGQADLVVMAREMLRDPYWPLHAALTLGTDVPWAPQYQRAKPQR